MGHVIISRPVAGIPLQVSTYEWYSAVGITLLVQIVKYTKQTRIVKEDQ